MLARFLLFLVRHRFVIEIKESEMTQHPRDMTPDLVKGVIHLLAHGDSEEWKKVYRQVEFRKW